MITELRLRNFKCFEELDLPLRPLTLLSGANSTGKSTVLQALLLLRQSWQHGSLARERRAVLNGNLIQLGDPSSTLREGADASPLHIVIVWSDGTEAGWTFTPKRRNERLDSERDLIVEAEPDDPTWPERTPFKSCRFVAADRVGPRLASPTSDIAVLDAGDIDPRGEFCAHYLAEYGERPMRNPALTFPGREIGDDTLNAASSKLRHEVEAWLGLLVPGARLVVERQNGIDLVKLTFQFPGVDAGPTEERRPTHVGFGLSYVLPVLLAVLSTAPGDLVLIENPEAHLHPRAQRLVVELLVRAAASGTQVVVETHSDHVLNGARLAVRRGQLQPTDAALHFFSVDRRTGKPTRRSPAIQPSGALTEWPEGFFDEWDRALDDLLT